MEVSTTKVHERVRAYIEDNGITLQHVAKKAGINRDRFYRMMIGKAPLVVDEFETICRDGLNVQPHIFFEQ